MFAEYIVALFIPFSLVHGQVEVPLEDDMDVGSDYHCNITQALLEKIEDLEQQNNNFQEQFNTLQDQLSKLLETSDAQEACFEDLGSANCTGSESRLVGIVEAVRVDGGWGSYSEWSQCSVTCGGGSQFRNRTCNNPSPQNGGKCTGDGFDGRKCNLEECCPVGWMRHNGQCYDCVHEANIDYNGNDLEVGRNFVKVVDAHECAKWCGKIEGCKFWTFQKVRKGCWLKHSDAGRRSNTDNTSGTKSCAKESTEDAEDAGEDGNAWSWW